MIRAFQAHQTALGLASDAMSSEARQFDRAFDGLGAAVGEKGAIQSGKLAQPLRQSSLIFVVIKIRDVNDFASLFANRLHDPRMRVPQRVHAQARNKIQILFSLEIVKENALPLFKGSGVTVLGRQEIALLKFDDLFQAGHV